MINLLPERLAPAIQAIKANLIEVVTAQEGAGKVWNRIRFAGDINEWLSVAAVEKIGGGDILRCVFVYQAGFTDTPAESNQRLYTAFMAIEIIQGFNDGTDGDNSTLFFENFTANLTETLNGMTELGFTEGDRFIEHTGLSGAEGDGRPQIVDGVLAHRKITTLSVKFKYCKRRAV